MGVKFLSFLVFFGGCLVCFSSDSFILLLGVLLYCFGVSLGLAFGVSSWYSLIFFLVYVGALLILFFYVFSLVLQPFWHISSFELVKLFVWVFATLFFVGGDFFIYSNSFYTASFNLFGWGSQLFMVFIGFFFLFLLWLLSKVGLFKISCLRPMF